MDQKNTRAPEESPQSDASLDTARTTRKLNPWMISTFILAVLLMAMAAASLVGAAPRPGFLMPPLSTPTPDTITSPDETSTTKTYFGTAKRGSEIEGGVRSWCAEGLYIVADESSYLFDQASFLLLNLPEMSNSEKYHNHRVRVTGLHDPSANRCEAMTCGCDDSITVSDITILDSEEELQNTTIFTGMLDCLPHRKTSGEQTLECAIGLKTDSGDYYGLQGLSEQETTSGKYSPGNKIRILGSILKTKAPNIVYKTVGVIEVVSIEPEYGRECQYPDIVDGCNSL